MRVKPSDGIDEHKIQQKKKRLTSNWVSEKLKLLKLSPSNMTGEAAAGCDCSASSGWLSSWGVGAEAGMLVRTLCARKALWCLVLFVGLLIKGIIRFFPKFRSYLVQWADKGGRRHHLTSFIPKLPNLPMVALQSWSVCHQVLLPAGGKYLYKYLYKPIAFTLASDI